MLGEIWKLAGNGKNKPTLSRNGWMVACLLVACAQQEGEPSIKAIANEDYELPDFNLGTDSTYSEGLTLPDGPKTFETNVAKPHTVGSVLNKHTEYAITVKTTMENYPASDLKINRRYSDFEWLYNRLARTFPGRVIPPIPEKQARNRFDKDFVEGRRLGLQKFLDEVTRDPAFAVTFDVQVFLTASSEGMSAARSVMPYGDGALTDMVNKAVAATRTGVSKVIETTTGNAMDLVDQTTEFGDVEYNLVKYSEQMKKVIAAEEKMVQSQAAEAKSFTSMAGYFTNFVMVARTFEDVDALDYYTKVSDNLKEMGDYIRLDSNAQNEGLVTDMRGFSGKALSVCQVIHNRDRCMKEVEKLDAAIEKAKDKVHEAKAEGKKAVKKAKEAVEKAKEKKEAKEKSCEEVLQGVKDGVVEFQTDRVKQGVLSLAKYGVQRVEYYEEMQNKCASLINLLGYTAEEIRDSNLRLKGYVDDIAAYEAALEALENMEQDESPIREDSESENESNSESESESESESDSDRKPAKKGKKPAKKESSSESESDDSDDSDSDDSDSDDSDSSDSDTKKKSKKPAKKPVKKAGKKKVKEDSDSDSDSEYAAM